MSAPSFIFGGNATAKTPEQLKRMRGIAETLAARTSAPKNVGEGIQAIANALNYRMMMDDASKAEAAGRAGASSKISQALFGGGTVTTVDPNTTAGAVIPPSDAQAEIAGTDPKPVTLSGDQQEFITAMLPAAIEEGKRTGVDPRIIVGQAAIETGYGRHAPGNNYFGIKSHGQEGGNSLMTTEVVNGQPVRQRDSFRTYAGPEESVRGYGDFITTNPRYGDFRAAQGLDAQLAALQASGYATDPKYSTKVGSVARGIQLPNQVASLDPASSMRTAPQAIDTVAPPSGQPLLPGDETTPYRDPVVSSPNAGRQSVADALAALPQQPKPVSPAVATVGAAMAGREAPPLPPPRNIAAPPAVAAVPDPQQVAQNGYYPPAPPPPGQPSQGEAISMRRLYEAAMDPWATDAQRDMVAREIQRRQAMNDPDAIARRDYMRAQTDALRARPGKQWQKLDDSTLFNPETGETKKVADSDTGGPGAFRFTGTSVEAQALNGLIESGALTADQAQQLAAGKQITNPADGSIIFMTPQGIFGKPASGGPAQPIGQQTGQGVDIFAGSMEGGAGGPMPAQPGQIGNTPPGAIPLTAPKPKEVQIPSEIGARIGMGDGFLERAPALRERLLRGDASGFFDGAQLMFGMGEPASIWRDIETGRDALVRNLTGAGMSESEARNQTARYQISPTDSARTMVEKLDNLERDLRNTRRGAIGAKTGNLGPEPPQRQPAGPQPGDVEDGFRFKGGNRADPNNWERVR